MNTKSNQDDLQVSIESCNGHSVIDEDSHMFEGSYNGHLVIYENQQVGL